MAFSVLRRLSADGAVLFVARAIRMGSYGALSLVFFLYLRGVGLADEQIGVLLTLILLGDLGITLYLTRHADMMGRKRTLIVGSFLKFVAGLVFALVSAEMDNTLAFALLLLAGTFGVISPSGGEIGPFLAVEQAALTEIITRTASASGGANSAVDASADVAALFGWHQAIAYVGQSLGALLSGALISAVVGNNVDTSAADGSGSGDIGNSSGSASSSNMPGYRAVVIAYAVCGGIIGVLYTRLSPTVEREIATGAAADNKTSATPSKAVDTDVRRRRRRSDAADAAPCIHVSCCSGQVVVTCSGRNEAYIPPSWYRCGLTSSRTRSIVLRLSLLFSIDAFAGGFAMQSFLVLWFSEVWGLDAVSLGGMIMGANVISAISGVCSGWLVKRIGAINTAVFTHAPSSVLLMLVPLMPSASSAVAMLLLRFTLSQMDVPARQAFLAMSVSSSERSAAGGVASIFRSVGLSLAPSVLGVLAAAPPDDWKFSAPFWIAGCLKITYDILLYISFQLTSKSSAASGASAPKAPASSGEASSGKGSGSSAADQGDADEAEEEEEELLRP
jgi:MFS family permease